MTILCATDFSTMAAAGVRAAALLAGKTNERLVLVHVLPETVPGLEDADRQTAESARANLERDAALLGTATEILVRVEHGLPAEMISAVAGEVGADLIVVAATSRAASRWLFGSTADRIASSTRIPLLAIREELRIAGWISGERALEVGVASDLSSISDNAIRWAARLARYGPCRFTLVHVSWPAEAYHRMGIDGPLTLDRSHPAVEALIASELALAKAELAGAGPCETVVAPPSRRPADALMNVAAERKIDLLVVGHEPRRAWRAWEGSVARSVIRAAPITVACVPRVDLARAQQAPRPRKIVAATDLSSAGNGAVAWALALVPPDGAVTILHVIEEAEIDAKRRDEIGEGLRLTAVDRRLTECRVEVRFELVESQTPASAIVRVAEKEEADMICVASRGRSHLPRILLGAVAQELLLTSRIPVLVVPPSRD